jgi:adenosylmethionine-8-amino-7-oxononanoate aminotransferase
MAPGIRCLADRLREVRKLAHVSDVRQWGYMVGIELVEAKENRKSYPPDRRIGHKVILEARKRGVLIRPLGDIVILMPPLTISGAELTTLLDVVYESIRAVTEA